MTAVCEVNVAPALSPGVFTGLTCGGDATVIVEYGCVHEHVRTEEVCAEHAEVLTSGDKIACTDCWAAGHFCQVIGRVLESEKP